MIDARDAEAGETRLDTIRIEDAQYDQFAIDGRDRRHPQVDELSGVVHLKAAILGNPTLRQIHSRAVLNLRHDRQELLETTLVDEPAHTPLTEEPRGGSVRGDDVGLCRPTGP